MTASGPSHVRDSFAAVALVFSLYVFFLLFAQFGFLAGIRASARGAADIHRVLAAMAIAGITTSLIAPRTVAAIDGARTMALGFFLNALAGGAAAAAFAERIVSTNELVVIALLTGAGLGFSTVAVAAIFRRLTRARATALHVGVGTGLAYFFCNLPDVFTTTASAKAWIAAAMSALGIVVALAVRRVASARDPMGAAARGDLSERLIAPRGIVCVACALLALVWFDSTAFTAVQSTPALRATMWGGAALWINAIVHAVAAIVAGAVLDRGWFRTTLVVAFVLLVGATFLFQADDNTALSSAAGPIYVAAVSIYSTALAAFAALAPERKGLPAPAWRAAIVYAFAGWIGSAAGVALAEQTGGLPPWAAPVATVLLGLSLLATVARAEAPG